MRLKVIKTDGSVEDYLHTKVIGAISSALACAGQTDVDTAEQLAEVVTYFVYHKRGGHSIPSSEIFSIIKAVLAGTRYEDAAAALDEHHFERRVRRSRVEVVSAEVQHITDANLLSEKPVARGRWDKSKIVNDLINEHGIERQTARMIASMVEDKVLAMGITLVPVSLIRQLVLGDAAVVLRAARELETVSV